MNIVIVDDVISELEAAQKASAQFPEHTFFFNPSLSEMRELFEGTYMTVTRVQYGLMRTYSFTHSDPNAGSYRQADFYEDEFRYSSDPWGSAIRKALEDVL